MSEAPKGPTVPELLPETAAELCTIARAARAGAYAPYSQFRVGAAVLGGSGTIYRGANVENSSYGLSICAERVAVPRAVAEGETAIAAVAVCAEPLAKDALVPPCGACLQVIAEFASPAAPILLCAPEGEPVIKRLDELLPFIFHLDQRSGA